MRGPAFSVLSEFRSRLVAGAMEAALLEALLARLGALGLVGYHLLRQVHGPGAPGWLRDLPAVQALRRIWIQQFYLQADEDGEKVIWRGAGQGLPPARSRLVSPYDTDARYAGKTRQGPGPGTRCTCPRPARCRTRPGGGRPRT